MECGGCLDQQSDFAARQCRFNKAVEILRVDVAFQHRLAVELDFDHGNPPDGIELGFVSPWNLSDHIAHFSGKAFKLLRVVAVDFAHQVGAGACHDFVETQLNGLSDQDILTRARGREACRA